MNILRLKSLSHIFLNNFLSLAPKSTILKSPLEYVIQNSKNKTNVNRLLETMKSQEAISDIFSGIYLSSTMKKRSTKMNKHKLKKRRKLLRMNTKVSRGK